MVLQESVTKISWGPSLHRQESAISHSSRRPQTETAGARQWEKPVMCSRQRGIKLQRKNAGGRKSEQHPYHLSVQSAVGGAHQESHSTATKEHARTDHQPSQQSSSARNEPSSSSSLWIRLEKDSYNGHVQLSYLYFPWFESIRWSDVSTIRLNNSFTINRRMWLHRLQVFGGYV